MAAVAVGLFVVYANRRDAPVDVANVVKGAPCGDGVCDAKEQSNPSLCPQDCSASATCGNNQCDSGETCSSCTQDCGSCPVVSSESRFGVHLGSLTYDSAAGYIRELGEQIYVRNEFFRDAFGWRQVKNEGTVSACRSCCDPTRSSCDCAVKDFYYCRADSREGLLSTPIVTDFYRNGFNQLVDFYADRYDDTAPKRIVAAYPTGHEDTYRGYVSFLVEHFGDKVKYWEVGNENEAAAFWGGTPQEYADLVGLASREIKQNCADCQVGISFANPGLSPKSSELNDEWFSAIGGICSAFDFIDAHFLSVDFITPGQLDKWRQTCPGKEFLSTETGVPDIIMSAGKPQNAGGSLEKQAQDLLKYNTLLFAEGYGKIYWYLIDTNYGSGEIFLHNALIDEDTTKKPAFTSYKTMIGKVDYFTAISKLADGQYKYTFANKNPVYVLWCDSGMCPLPSETSGTVTVTDYLGAAETKNANQIRLTESPVFVETR